MRHLLALVLGISVLFILSGCMGDSDSDPVIAPTSTAATVAQLAAGQTAAQAGTANQMANVTTDAALANVSDFSMLALVPVPAGAIRAVSALPTLPTQAPTYPSGVPAMTFNTVLGTAPDTATVNWYMYVSPLDPTVSWGEWKTTVAKGNIPLFTAFWQISAPLGLTEFSHTRGFSGSGWANGALAIYTVGTGTYIANGMVLATGTQVAVVKVGGIATMTAFGFSVNKMTDGSIVGGISFANGDTTTFTRSAPNTAAIGTTNAYAQTQGLIKSSVPIARTLTYTSTVFGKNTMTVQVVAPGAATTTTTLNYSPDGSGSGSVTGIPGKTISLLWDMSGGATATIQVGTQTVVYPTNVTPRPVDEVPGA